MKRDECNWHKTLYLCIQNYERTLAAFYTLAADVAELGDNMESTKEGEHSACDTPVRETCSFQPSHTRSIPPFRHYDSVV
jgi:hypothetical protein